MDYNEYIGIPFLDAGRDRNGLDCWGLVRLVLAERFGKTLPSFLTYDKIDTWKSELLIDAGRELVSADQVAIPEAGDIAVMTIRGIPAHVGVYIGDGLVLHTDRGTASIAERIDSPRIVKRIQGWFHV